MKVLREVVLLLVPEQGKGGKLGKVLAKLEDEDGLDAAVGEDEAAVLGVINRVQLVAVLGRGHDALSVHTGVTSTYVLSAFSV